MSQQINLYNPILRKQKKYFSAPAMAQALGLVLAGVLGVYAFAAWQGAGLARQAQDAGRLLEREQARLAALDKEVNGRQKSAILEEEIRAADKKLKEREEVLAFLAGGKLGNRDGFSEHMRAFARQSVNGLWLTGFSLAADRLSVSGGTVRADLVPAYIKRLGQERAFQGRAFAALEIKAPPAGEPSGAGSDKPAARKFIEFRLQSGDPEAATTAGGR